MTELEELALAWINGRDSLSSDCYGLGITSRDQWIDELLRRERPFRQFMQNWLALKTQPACQCGHARSYHEHIDQSRHDCIFGNRQCLCKQFT